LIEQILPGTVAAVDMFADPPDATLLPEERAAVAKAVEKRRLEYTTVRVCARAALVRLGLPPVPIVPGQRGAPRWPDGVAGSMTHCAGYRAAAVARIADVASVGIDAEPDEPLPDGVLEAVAFGAEPTMLRELARHDAGVSWDRLLFSAKESVYKTWFPLTRRWLGFEEAAISIDPAGGTFTADLLVEGPVVDGTRCDRFEGRWIAKDGLVVTAIVLPSRPGAA
jgi:4'-phosphopantetheinyl transferase EntD